MTSTGNARLPNAMKQGPRGNNRLAALREAMARRRIDALLVTNVENIAYLSGFTGGDSALLISARSQYIVTDFRYVEQAAQECPHFGLIQQRKGGVLKAAAGKINQLHTKTLGFEGSCLSVVQHGELKTGLKAAQLKKAAGIVENLRLVKSSDEVKAIRAAIRAAEQGYRDTLSRLKPGMTEREAAAELGYQMRKSGADKEAFDLIVAAQERASLPHARPTDKRLAAGNLVLFDWGSRAAGYCSDMTRVAFLGRIPRKFRNIYAIVLEAQLAAIDKVAPGVAASSVDAAAREIIGKAGYADNFGHSTGHGVGLNVHEGPRIGMRSDIKLSEGMVFTVEPGIYLPGEGGVRIEDMVRVSAHGAEVLTHIPKDIGHSIVK